MTGWQHSCLSLKHVWKLDRWVSCAATIGTDLLFNYVTALCSGKLLWLNNKFDKPVLIIYWQNYNLTILNTLYALHRWSVFRKIANDLYLFTTILCRINGVPACANQKLLTDILRNEWGFEGNTCILTPYWCIIDPHNQLVTYRLCSKWSRSYWWVSN